MFDRLTAFLTPLWVLSIAGAIVIVGLALGFMTWLTFVVAGIVGLVGIPLAMWNAKKIRRDDPNWRKDRPAGGKVL
ncbi:hypothetical protein [Celeribacter indicus]|uniref:Uncharacterized protein n=1 Tax=Celeribacter indicus TaxID=1208324 RepID=A0A0B5DR86_9RHOB|nr:hypothetical protein [Celeribacter indicus]AJE45589.1 hypothetical protein P73_0874 [Celeribacter indicus]SDW85220.1 hypothetical protein SAMN05443573_10862 [Celeribacter indicus]